MTAPTIPVRISGKTYHSCCDPLCSGVPDEIGLTRAPQVTRRVGRGHQHTYTVDLRLALNLLDHLDTMAECRLTGSDDPDDRAEGRSIRTDADRLRSQLAALTKASTP